MDRLKDDTVIEAMADGVEQEGYKIVRSNFGSLVDPSVVYAPGSIVRLCDADDRRKRAKVEIGVGRSGLYYCASPLGCGVDPMVRRLLYAVRETPLELAFIQVRAVGHVTRVDALGQTFATDAIEVVRAIDAQEWRRLCTGTVAVPLDSGTVRIERYHCGRLHSPEGPDGRALPAVVLPNGHCEWFRHGLRHRCDCFPSNAQTRDAPTLQLSPTRAWSRFLSIRRTSTRQRDSAAARASCVHCCARPPRAPDSACVQSSRVQDAHVDETDSDMDVAVDEDECRQPYLCRRRPAVVEADGTRHWYLYGALTHSVRRPHMDDSPPLDVASVRCDRPAVAVPH